MTTQATRAIGFKGRMMTLTLMEVSSLDLAVIEQALVAQIERSPGFFESMPVMLSLPDASIDLPGLVTLLRGKGLVPVAVFNPDAAQADAAVDAGLGVLKDHKAGGGQRQAPEPATEPKPKPKPESARQAPEKPAAAETRTTARMITSPVRSGQQIYARGTDLICTAAVSEGAEIIADGSIHVYGALRGRALAGATGDANARIFCRRFEAELVAVAGCYKVAEDMADAVRGKAVQVRLDGENLLLELQE